MTHDKDRAAFQLFFTERNKLPRDADLTQYDSAFEPFKAWQAALEYARQPGHQREQKLTETRVDADLGGGHEIELPPLPYSRPIDNGYGKREMQAYARQAIAHDRANRHAMAEEVCAEAYQVVGSLISDLGVFETEQAQKILDNLSEARVVHHDVLPWPSFDRQRRGEAVAWPKANADEAAGGWILSYAFLDRVEKLAGSRTDFSTSMEAAEQILIAANEVINAAPQPAEPSIKKQINDECAQKMESTAQPAAPVSGALPKVGSVWEHYNGNRYTVVSIANECTEHHDKYPVMVCYRGDNNNLLAMPLSTWLEGMKLVSDEPVSAPDESAALEHFEQRFNEIEEGDGDIPLPQMGDGKRWDEYVERHKAALTGWVLRREYEQSQRAVDRSLAHFQAAMQQEKP